MVALKSPRISRQPSYLYLQVSIQRPMGKDVPRYGIEGQKIGTLLALYITPTELEADVNLSIQNHGSLPNFPICSSS